MFEGYSLLNVDMSQKSAILKVALPPLNFIVLIFLQLTDTLGTVKYVYNKSTEPLFKPN